MYDFIGQLIVIPLIYVVVSTVRGSVAVSKQGAQKFSQERIILRNPNELKVRREYRIKTSIGIAGFDN